LKASSNASVLDQIHLIHLHIQRFGELADGTCVVAWRESPFIVCSSPLSS
jgi:hypothetical protein